MANFAEIVAVEVTPQANAGDRVDVIVKVKNLVSEGAITIAVTGLYDYTNPLPQPPILTVSALQVGEFPTSFIMPNKSSVAIHVGSWYKIPDGTLVPDDLVETSVLLSTEPPPGPPSPDDALPWGKLALIGGAAALGLILVSKK